MKKQQNSQLPVKEAARSGTRVLLYTVRYKISDHSSCFLLFAVMQNPFLASWCRFNCGADLCQKRSQRIIYSLTSIIIWIKTSSYFINRKVASYGLLCSEFIGSIIYFSTCVLLSQAWRHPFQILFCSCGKLIHSLPFQNSYSRSFCVPKILHFNGFDFRCFDEIFVVWFE